MMFLSSAAVYAQPTDAKSGTNNQVPAKFPNEATLEVQVRDVENGRGLPCRLTIVDHEGDLAPIHAIPGQMLAVRLGVVYTRDGHAELKLPAGNYVVYATRGFEYGLDQRKVSLAPGQSRRVRMRIRREVATSGWVACDTHIHTLTLSGHGDASLDERMLTLAGEGIELPIATEHNLAADYSPAAHRLHLERYFTPVIGCELTTDAGHFSIFPIKPGSRLPDFHITDWPKLMESIRSTPGVQVAILNHPRDFHNRFSPFAATNFNPVTAENLRGPEFTFDGMEVINSSALQSDLMQNYRDWFALLNHGYRVTAVGASDCHDVNLFIVGQGRSYVAADDSAPLRIDVGRACQSLREGRVLVSLGLLAEMTVNKRFNVGDLATGLGDTFRVEVKVQGPSWVRADRVELFANGTRIGECSLESAASRAGRQTVVWNLPRPLYDVYLVAIASGPGISARYWPIPRPYQPTSPVWNPRVMASTNPIWIDANGDGKFTAARQYARKLFAQFGSEPERLIHELAKYDEAIAAHAASFCHSAGKNIRSEDFGRLLKAASEPVRRGFAAFSATLQ